METLKNTYAAEQLSRIQIVKPVWLWCSRAAQLPACPQPSLLLELAEPAMPQLEQYKHFCIDTPCAAGCGCSVKAISESPGTMPSFRQSLQPPARHTEPAPRTGEAVGRKGFCLHTKVKEGLLPCLGHSKSRCPKAQSL